MDNFMQISLSKETRIFPEFFSYGQCDCNIYTFVQSVYSQHNFNVITNVYFELTPTCNNNCAGCGNVFVSDKPSRKTDTDNAGLSLSQWHTLIEKLPSHLTHVNITGGEPTLSPYFDEFIRMIDKKGLSFTLFTNARWNKPQEILNILLSSKGLKGLLISLHGKDAFTHEAFTQAKGSFEHSLENIKLAASHGIPVTLSTIINRYNYSQVRSVYDLANRMGINRLVFSRYVGLYDDECAPTDEQLKQALTDIESIQNTGAAIKLSVTIPQCFYPSSSRGCGAGRSYVTVDPWGNVRPCNHSPLILGNLLDTSLDAMIDSEPLKTWHNLVSSQCKQCSEFALCGGGCKAEAMLNHQSYDSLIRLPN